LINIRRAVKVNETVTVASKPSGTLANNNTDQENNVIDQTSIIYHTKNKESNTKRERNEKNLNKKL